MAIAAPNAGTVEVAAPPLRVDVFQTSATSTVDTGIHLLRPALRPVGCSLRPDGVQLPRVASPAVQRRPYSREAITDALRAAGVPVDRLTEIARTLDNEWHGDPERAAQIDAEIMEDLAPLRAKANRAELPDWE